MKKILFSLLFIPMVGMGQKLVKADSSYSSYSSIQFITKDQVGIQLITELNGKKDTSVYIQGDTMALLKGILIDYMSLSTKYWEARAVLDRININFLSTWAFKGDKQFLNAVKKYNKNKNKW